MASIYFNRAEALTPLVYFAFWNEPFRATGNGIKSYVLAGVLTSEIKPVDINEIKNGLPTRSI